MKNRLIAIGRFYVEGFRSMTTGRVLWCIILLKLFFLFCVLRFFFFPDRLGHLPDDARKADYVGRQLTERGQSLPVVTSVNNELIP